MRSNFFFFKNNIKDEHVRVKRIIKSHFQYFGVIYGTEKKNLKFFSESSFLIKNYEFEKKSSIRGS